MAHDDTLTEDAPGPQPAPAPLPWTELTALLEHSRGRNAAEGLTGMLLHADGHFVQTLEGPAEVVDAAFGRILVDRRHRNVDVALREEVDARRFPSWSMGFRAVGRDEVADLPGFSDFLDRGTGTLPDGPGRADVFHRVFRATMR